MVTPLALRGLVDESALPFFVSIFDGQGAPPRQPSTTARRAGASLRAQGDLLILPVLPVPSPTGITRR